MDAITSPLTKPQPEDSARKTMFSERRTIKDKTQFMKQRRLQSFRPASGTGPADFILSEAATRPVRSQGGVISDPAQTGHLEINTRTQQGAWAASK
jgi:hypothetical protein